MIKDNLEHLRELLNKAIKMEADTDEIIKISQMLDNLIVEYMASPSYWQTSLSKDDKQDELDNRDEDA